MNDFDRALAFVLTWEGGDKITRDALDPGGTTRYGISQRAYPNLIIDQLTYEQAAEIYRKDYWIKNKCDQLPSPLGFVHFDASVNCGRVQAAKFLQRAAGVTDDGDIGYQTLQACKELDAKDLAKHTIIEREKYYRKLVDSRPPLARFLDGWLNRTASLLGEIA